MTNGTPGFVGINEVRHKNLFAVPYVDAAARRKTLEEVKEFAEAI